MDAAPPLISVVIPCHNQGHYLAEAIASVGSASSAPGSVEIIVVDDGSTDDTQEVARKCPRVRVLVQANAGLARARNRGLSESRGRYVVFLDADDRLAPDGLDRGFAAIVEHADCEFVYGRCTMMAADGSLLPTPPQPHIERDHYRELLKSNLIWTPAMAMFQRAAVEAAGGFRPDFNAAADYDLYLRITRTSRVYDHGAVVAHYRRHDANMSGDAARMLRETLAALAAQRQYASGDRTLSRAYRDGWRNWQDFYGTHLVNEIRAHVHAGQWRQALRKAATLARLHPRGLGQHAVQKLRVALGATTD